MEPSWGIRVLIGAVMLVSGSAHAADAVKFLKLEGQNVRWIAPDRSGVTTITYAFADQRLDTPHAYNCRSIMPLSRLLATSGISKSVFRNEARAAFAMWESAANIQFVEVEDTDAAGIVIGAQTRPKGWAYANVETERTPAGNAAFGAITRARICLNPLRRWKIGFDGRLDVYDVRYTLAHEIGHAIGLDHPGPSGHLMSFRYDETFRRLQAGDVWGAAVLYGVRSKQAPVGRAVWASRALTTPHRPAGVSGSSRSGSGMQRSMAFGGRSSAIHRTTSARAGN